MDGLASGGELIPSSPLAIARRGRAVVFHNVLPGTNTLNPRSLHAGLPVEAEVYGVTEPADPGHAAEAPIETDPSEDAPEPPRWEDFAPEGDGLS